MRIVNVKKFIKMIMIILGIIVVLILLFSNKSYSKGKVKEKIIYVSNGDTLWNIAIQEQESNNYYTDRDIRDIVYEIKKINNLENNSTLKVGQKLIVNSL